MKEKNKKEYEQRKQGFKPTKNYNTLFLIFSILNFTAILFSFIFLMVFLYLPNSFQGNNINEYTNDYCQNKENEYYEFLCTNKYYKYNIKKSKFIWLISDGTASDQTIILGDKEKSNISSIFLANAYIPYKHNN